MPKKSKSKSTKEAKHYVVERASAGGTSGYYSSKSGPSAAARKAANKRFTKSVTKIRITVRETGSDRTFTYDVQRVKLPKAFVSTIAGREIRREYTTKIKAVK